MKKLCFAIVLAFAVSHLAHSQDNFPYNGVKDERTNSFAFINAMIHTDHATTLDSATLLIRDGKVLQVGKNIALPKGFTVIDCGGKHLYPSFVDLNTSYGFQRKKEVKGGRPTQISPLTPGAYNANDAINSFVNAAEHFTTDTKQAANYRKHGFGTALSYNTDGIARGTSTVVLLSDENENETILLDKASAHYSFNKGTSKQTYPSSVMGAVALLRQTFLDAKWYKDTKPHADLSLEAWNNNLTLPQVFDAGNKHSILRADKVGDEFGVQYIINSGGDEYQNIAEIKATNATLIVPLVFPKAYNVDDPLDARHVSLRQMKHWELAPHNLRILHENNVPFVITSKGAKGDFIKNLRKAVDAGLPKEVALKGLTHFPASLVKLDNKIGKLEKGYIANFIMTSDDFFDKEALILENWVNGIRYEINPEKQEIEEGLYTFDISSTSYSVEAKKSSFKIVVNDSTKAPLKHTLDDELITLSFEDPTDSTTTRLSGWKIAKGWQGKGQNADGNWFNWSLTFESTVEQPADTTQTNKQNTDEVSSVDTTGKIIYPFTAYGQEALPAAQSLLIKNITAWTNENEGILDRVDVLIENGKIAAIGKNLSAKNVIEIDGEGKHLTPGILDEHSHIALFSVNDRATNSGMVRMEDVINPEDINIYRQLAGGVTTSQLLHGSANPIGGQSAIVKLKWGRPAHEMLIRNADPFIKFALGENVKQSNWGSGYRTRYPQTRMGVEQVYVDAFTNALDYEKSWQQYLNLPRKAKANATAPRKDLAQEAMLEIIRKKRFITCHSYVQSEINMLMKVAEKFDFNVNTFTHILEGYKVADKMKAHGVGASTFADWWAYKWEVRYAIPYNAALMHNEGVTVAINSDDAEMGRRLNQEAAKVVKYGGINEEEALKLVTLNPAKLLHLDHKIGSIKVGKDADLVIWNNHPLSVYSKPEKTLIEGVVYYDIEKDAELRRYIQEERQRLIAKMKGAKAKGEPTQAPRKEKVYDYHCDDLDSGLESTF